MRSSVFYGGRNTGGAEEAKSNWDMEDKSIRERGVWGCGSGPSQERRGLTSMSENIARSGQSWNVRSRGKKDRANGPKKTTRSTGFTKVWGTSLTDCILSGYRREGTKSPASGVEKGDIRGKGTIAIRNTGGGKPNNVMPRRGYEC